MNEERKHFLTHFNAICGSPELTYEEFCAGFHWCTEWDDLMVGPDDVEEWGEDNSTCRCGHTFPSREEKAEFIKARIRIHNEAIDDLKGYLRELIFEENSCV